jgi:hypothetical protein
LTKIKITVEYLIILKVKINDLNKNLLKLKIKKDLYFLLIFVKIFIKLYISKIAILYFMCFNT